MLGWLLRTGPTPGRRGTFRTAPGWRREEACGSRTAPSEGRFSPSPVRAFPASYARFPRVQRLGPTKSNAARSVRAPDGIGDCFPPDVLGADFGRAGRDDLGLRQVGGRAAVRRPGPGLERVGLEGVVEHLVHLGDEDELDVLLGLLSLIHISE